MGWYYGNRTNLLKSHEEVEAVIMLERVRNVHKLILVEGTFSEIYDYKDYWFYDVSPFRKKALVRVKADVLVGFDLEKADIRLEEADHTIYLNDLPKSEILSIDHDLDYYDLQEGTFNQFDEKKLTEINKGAKNFIRTQAEMSDLIERAEQRKGDFIRELQITASAFGWNVQVSAALLGGSDVDSQLLK